MLTIILLISFILINVSVIHNFKTMEKLHRPYHYAENQANLLRYILNSWLSNMLMKSFNEQFSNFANLFVVNWKAARPVIKYFENRNTWQKPQSIELKIQFTSINQTTLNHIIEILDNHGLNFWNVNRLSVFLLTQLLAGSDEQFSIPITNDYQINFTRVHNEILQSKIESEG